MPETPQTPWEELERKIPESNDSTRRREAAENAFNQVADIWFRVPQDDPDSEDCRASCIEAICAALDAAYQQGREDERQRLHSLIDESNNLLREAATYPIEPLRTRILETLKRQKP